MKCTKCSKNKAITEFNFKNKSLGIRHKQCKKCTRFSVKNHYNENRQYYLEKTKIRNQGLRREIIEYINHFLSINPCVDCGERDIVVLEFDHGQNRDIKLDAVSRMIRYRTPLKVIKEEINKCQIRCANCHRRKTAQEFKWSKINKRS